MKGELNKRCQMPGIIRKTSNHKGITLIALVITIIVMLILVAVTISLSINGGLFGYAGSAAEQTKTAREDEQNWTNVEGGLTTEDLIAKYTNDNRGLDLAKLKKYFEGYTSDDIGEGPFTNNERLADASSIILVNGICIKYNENYYKLTFIFVDDNGAELTGLIPVNAKKKYTKVEAITEEQAFPYLVTAYGIFLRNDSSMETEYYIYNDTIYKITKDGATEATEREIDEKIKVTVAFGAQTISFIPNMVEDSSAKGGYRLQNWYEWANDTENNQDIELTRELTLKELIIQCEDNSDKTIKYSSSTKLSYREEQKPNVMLLRYGPTTYNYYLYDDRRKQYTTSVIRAGMVYEFK